MNLIEKLLLLEAWDDRVAQVKNLFKKKLTYDADMHKYWSDRFLTAMKRITDKTIEEKPNYRRFIGNGEHLVPVAKMAIEALNAHKKRETMQIVIATYGYFLEIPKLVEDRWLLSIERNKAEKDGILFYEMAHAVQTLWVSKTNKERLGKASKDFTETLMNPNDPDLVYQDENVMVYWASSPRKSILYGLGNKSGLCTSRTEGNMWTNYTNKGYTMYFVFTKKQRPDIDGEFAHVPYNVDAVTIFKHARDEEDFGEFEYSYNPIIDEDGRWFNDDATITKEKLLELHPELKEALDAGVIIPRDSQFSNVGLEQYDFKNTLSKILDNSSEYINYDKSEDLNYFSFLRDNKVDALDTVITEILKDKKIDLESLFSLSLDYPFLKKYKETVLNVIVANSPTEDHYSKKSIKAIKEEFPKIWKRLEEIFHRHVLNETLPSHIIYVWMPSAPKEMVADAIVRRMWFPSSDQFSKNEIDEFFSFLKKDDINTIAYDYAENTLRNFDNEHYRMTDSIVEIIRFLSQKNLMDNRTKKALQSLVEHITSAKVERYNINFGSNFKKLCTLYSFEWFPKKNLIVYGLNHVDDFISSALDAFKKILTAWLSNPDDFEAKENIVKKYRNQINTMLDLIDNDIYRKYRFLFYMENDNGVDFLKRNMEVFLNDDKISEEYKNFAVFLFSEKIKNNPHIPTDPDWTSIFDLSAHAYLGRHMKKILNGEIEKSTLAYIAAYIDRNILSDRSSIGKSVGFKFDPFSSESIANDFKKAAESSKEFSNAAVKKMIGDIYKKLQIIDDEIKKLKNQPFDRKTNLLGYRPEVPDLFKGFNEGLLGESKKLGMSKTKISILKEWMETY